MPAAEEQGGEAVSSRSRAQALHDSVTAYLPEKKALALVASAMTMAASRQLQAAASDPNISAAEFKRIREECLSAAAAAAAASSRVAAGYEALAEEGQSSLPMSPGESASIVLAQDSFYARFRAKLSSPGESISYINVSVLHHQFIDVCASRSRCCRTGYTNV